MSPSPGLGQGLNVRCFPLASLSQAFAGSHTGATQLPSPYPEASEDTGVVRQQVTSVPPIMHVRPQGETSLGVPHRQFEQVTAFTQ